MPKRTLIIGIGSILQGDDGIGPRVIDRLEQEPLPLGVKLERADLYGLDLLKYFTDFDRVIIIDAARMGKTPGTIKVFSPAQIKKASFDDIFSSHGIGLLEILTLAQNLDMNIDVRIIAIEPKNIGHSLELSDKIKACIHRIIIQVKEELQV